MIVHVAPAQGVTGDPAEAELQPDRQEGRPNVRKVIYTASRTAAWVAASRIADLPDEPAAPAPTGTRAEQALAHITTRPGITIPELAEAMGIKQNYLYRVMPTLEQEGRVRKEGKGWHPS